MGFLVWGHHMYLVGLDHRSRSLYSTVTVMISLPAVVKLVNWTLTLQNSNLETTPSLYYIFSFILFFLSGGITGLWLSHVSLNVFVHDTFYVVAHFHFMFSCAVFSSIFALYFHYYFLLWGFHFNKNLVYLHLFYWTCGQWVTFVPLFWVGYNGLPRRYHDYPLIFAGWHGLASAGHILSLISVILFFVIILNSFFNKSLFSGKTVLVPRSYKRLQFYLRKI